VLSTHFLSGIVARLLISVLQTPSLREISKGVPNKPLNWSATGALSARDNSAAGERYICFWLRPRLRNILRDEKSVVKAEIQTALSIYKNAKLL
jgi:hypothetical protein